jgi:hypothetical protein
MSPWLWVLIGLAAWFAPAVMAALMLGWAIWRRPRARPPAPDTRVAEKPAGLQEPPSEGQPPHGGAAA